MKLPHSVSTLLIRLFGMLAAGPLVAAPAILNNSLPVGVVAAPYAIFSLSANGGTAPYTWTITAGTLPAGLSFSTGGAFSGTPTALDAASLTFQVKDAVNATATKTLTLTVSPPPAPPQWTARGLSGGWLRQVVVSPDYANDQTLFTYGQVGEYFHSVNKGASWNRVVPLPFAPGNRMDALILSPTYSQLGTANPDVQTIFASSASSLMKSVDHGLTFTTSSTGLADGAGPLAISPAYPTDGTLWAGNPYGLPTGGAIYRSVNKGVSFTKVSTIAAYTTGIQQIAVSPNYAVDHILLIIGQLDKRVYKSTNSGTSWTLVYTFSVANDYPQEILFSPRFATDNTIFLRDPYNAFKSTTGGTAFVALATPGATVLGFAAAGRPALSPLLYFRIQRSPPYYSVLASDDYGVTFTPAYAGNLRASSPSFPVNTPLVASSLLSGGVPDLYAPSSLGVDGSDDGGFSFTARDRGLAAIIFNNLGGAGATLVGEASDRWYKSSDGGAGWVQNLPPTGQSNNLCAISPNYAADHALFIGTQSGIFRSLDGGVTFSAATYAGTGAVLQFAVAPDFTPASGVVLAATTSGLFRSVNGGQNFTLVNIAAGCPMNASSYVDSVAVSPSFAVDQTVFADPGFGPLCRSTDRGVTWTQVSAGGGTNMALSNIYNNNAANGTTAKMMWVLGGGQIQRSTNGGVTFTSTGSFADRPIVVSPRFDQDGTVLAATTQGILRSSDFGATFASLGLGDPLRNRRVQGLYLAPAFDGGNSVNSVAVAATYGSGIWASTDGGRNFNPVTGYQSLSASLTGLARGAGASPSTPIFAATADQGIFQSTDSGATFGAFSTGLPADANTRAVTVPAAAPASPVAAVRDASPANQGLYRYGGGLWTKITAGGAGDYAGFLDDGSYLYAARRDGISLRSADGGINWTSQDAAQTDLVNLDYNNQSGPTLVIPAAARRGGGRSPGAATVNTAALWAVSQTGGARYSADSGSTWIPATGAGDYTLPAGATYTTVRALGINPVSLSREVLAGTTTGLYRTTDGGMSWRSASGPGSGLEATSRIFSAFVTSQTPAGATDILAGINGSTTGGVYLSGDGGEHWTQINQGFDPNSLNITTLIKTSCSGCPVQYYTGTYGSGVFTRTIAVNAAPAFPSASAACFGTTTCTCGTTGWNGPEAGGQPFKLCGANFQALAAVEFDGLAATGCLTVNATTITCTGTPLHVPGAAAVRVRNTDTRAGYLPALYTYDGGGSRASGLLVAKSGNDANLTYSCPGCTTPPPRVFRSQNAPFTLNIEQYTGGAASYTNTGALAAGANAAYFWSVE